MKNEYKYLFLSLIPLLIAILLLKDALFEEKKYEIYLNGEMDETYFVNEFIDKGALAFENDLDISYRIIRESNVIPSEVGDYEIVYSIGRKNVKDEYTVKRNVHIIDVDLIRKVDKANHKIIMSILSNDYLYTVLPNEKIIYDRNIEYIYDGDGDYKFNVYLQNGLFKTYHFKVSNFDKDGPEVKCTIKIENNSLHFNVNAFDNNGVLKYVFNNKEYLSNDFILNMNEIGINNKVRVYDNLGNYTDSVCHATMNDNFKSINNSKNGYFKCNSDNTSANRELQNIVEVYGNKTRDAVVAAALYLTNYQYNVSYTWGGKSLSKGLNNNWGCPISVSEDKCTNSLGNNYCEAGLDCTGFTAWAFAQAGFDKEIIRTSSQSTGMWGSFNAGSHRYSFVDNQNRVNLIKIGDLVHTEGHIGMVIGVDNNTLQIANMVGPIVISVINKSNGNSINNQHSFDNFVLFDEFYAMYGNKL